MRTLIALGFLVFTLNVYATVRLVRSTSYSRQQALLQALLVWVVPIVGASVVLIVMQADRTSSLQVRHPTDASPEIPGTEKIGLPGDVTHNAGSHHFGGH